MSYNPDFTKDGRPRTRRRGACATCRKRKMRCDGERPSCTGCRKSQIPCMYMSLKDLTEAESEALTHSIEESKNYLHTRDDDGQPIYWTDKNGIVREKSRHACDRCKAKKSRCSGHVPECETCIKLCLPCNYSPRKRNSASTQDPNTASPKRRKTASPEVRRVGFSVQATAQIPEAPVPTPPRGPGKGIRGPIAPRNSSCLNCRTRKQRCVGEVFPCESCQAHGIPCNPQDPDPNARPPNRSAYFRQRQRYHEDDASEQLRREMNEADPEAAKERPFPCPECGRRFSRREHLNRHMVQHSGHKAFGCQHSGCGRAFYRSDQLLKHSRLHGVNEDNVPRPPKGYKRQAAPLPHSNHHEVRICYGCERRFDTATAFYAHFPCVATGGAKNSTIEHETPATMEKRLTWCGACGRNFRDKYELQGHLPCERAKTDFGDFVSQLEQAASTSATPPHMQYG